MATQDTGGAPIPPYEGRQTEAHAETETEKEGARTGGATAPVSDDAMKAPSPPASGASPADEQPAENTPEGEPGEAATGPAHTPGNAKGEEQS